jgi:hypothetical protein
MQIYRTFLVFVLLLCGGQAIAHQFTPTYPKFEPSFIDGVLQTKMELFNKRQEVGYYELDVFDQAWNPVSFASSQGKIIQVQYLETKSIEIYLKNQDIKRAVYICTESRLFRNRGQQSLVSSKICSKIKP